MQKHIFFRPFTALLPPDADTSAAEKTAADSDDGAKVDDTTGSAAITDDKPTIDEQQAFYEQASRMRFKRVTTTVVPATKPADDVMSNQNTATDSNQNAPESARSDTSDSALKPMEEIELHNDSAIAADDRSVRSTSDAHAAPVTSESRNDSAEAFKPMEEVEIVHDVATIEDRPLFVNQNEIPDMPRLC